MKALREEAVCLVYPVPIEQCMNQRETWVIPCRRKGKGRKEGKKEIKK